MVCHLLQFMLYALAHENLRPGAGYDQIDVDACTKHDVRVSNVPTAVDDATADTNMVGSLHMNESSY
jgi:lactate dehydrogenase-like 2-hydroxyacid dehydrogenase